MRLENTAATVDACLDEVSGPIGESRLPVVRGSIDACFGAGEMPDIVQCLASERTDFGAEQLGILATKSPLAVRLTCAQLRRGRGLSIAEALRLEYRMVHRMLPGHDFAEGVRALLVDKDRRPRWRHPELQAVPGDEIEACMAPLPAGDLALDWSGP